MKVVVTRRQHEYLLILSESPKTTRELTSHFGVADNSVLKILHKLIDKGLVKSERICDGGGRAPTYHLTKPYDTLEVTIKNYTGTGNPRTTPDAEILYAAILRNGGMVGQRLYGQFKRLFPDRSDSSIKHTVGIARNRGLNGMRLCR